MSRPKFKIGDRVRILDGSKINGYCGGWVDNMNKYISEIVTIDSVSPYMDFPIAYYLEEYPYKWDERGLELVKPELEKPKYYTGKVVCVSPFSPFYTKGKVYEIKDGVGKNDAGDRMTNHPVKSFEEFSQKMISEFIELVE